MGINILEKTNTTAATQIGYFENLEVQLGYSPLYFYKTACI